MSVLEELVHELNEMVLPLWVFPERTGYCSETVPSLFAVIREALAWTAEGERSNPAVVFILLKLISHNPQEGKIFHRWSCLIVVLCVAKNRLSHETCFSTWQGLWLLVRGRRILRLVGVAEALLDFNALLRQGLMKLERPFSSM